MSAATDYAAPVARSGAPRPWWRGRFGLVVAILLGLLVAFLGWKNQLNWPAALVWNSLTGYLDRFQVWLSDNRNVAHPNGSSETQYQP